MVNIDCIFFLKFSIRPYHLNIDYHFYLSYLFIFF
jgi:hypothetical protein